MGISLLCVLQVNEVAIVGYAPSWILGSKLEAIEFLTIASEYPLHDYPHIGLQHQSLLVVIISL
jgi:hypothetical protein